jgi:prepilin-type processing-associated H-X9-DG protein
MARRDAPSVGGVCCAGGWNAEADRYTLHNGGSNLAFADGHAKFLTGPAIKTIQGGGGLRYYQEEW